MRLERVTFDYESLVVTSTYESPSPPISMFSIPERSIYTNDDGSVLIWEQDLPKLGQIGISPLPFFEIGPPFLGNEMTAG